MKKIDMHCHATKNRLPSTMIEDATLDVIAREMDLHSIEKTVVLASYFPANGSKKEGSGISNFRLLHWIEEHSAKEKFIMFGSLDFEHYYHQGLNELTELAGKGLIKGIKIYTAYQDVDFKKLYDVAMICRDNSLPMMFHGGEISSTRFEGGGYDADLGKIERYAERFPDVSFIISHMAQSKVEELIPFIKRNHNIYTDTSGVFNSRYHREEIPYWIDMVDLFVNECGADKLLFGTDFPIQSHKDSVYLIEEGMRNYSKEEKRKVYSGNAKRILRLMEV